MSGGMNNYGLSVRRAETTFTMLQRNQPALRGFLNRPAGDDGSAPILSLSGYGPDRPVDRGDRTEEHTSELQSLMRTSYAVFCLTKNNNTWSATRTPICTPTSGSTTPRSCNGLRK